MASTKPTLNVTEETVVNVPLDQIREVPGFNTRSYTASEDVEINTLVDKMLASPHGQETPIILEWNEDAKTFDLIAGHRRFEALKRIKARTKKDDVTARAIVRTFANDLDRFNANISENLDRKNLGPMSMALTANRLKEMGLTNERIGGVLNVSKAYVTQFLSIAKAGFDADTQKKIESGEIGMVNAIELSKVAPEERGKKVAEVKEKLEKGEKVTTKDVQKATKDAPKVEKGAGGRGKTAKDEGEQDDSIKWREFRNYLEYVVDNEEKYFTPTQVDLCKQFLRLKDGKVEERGWWNAMNRYASEEEIEETKAISKEFAAKKKAAAKAAKAA